MKLSIITINYNNIEGLKKTIDSVVSQTFKDFEWIVIDGGSTDGSKQLIEKYKNDITFWVSEPDKGIYDAMNKGLKVAQGEYCQFLNSGDYLINKYTLKKVFDKQIEGDVNYGDVWFLSENRIIEKRVYPEKMNLSFLFNFPLGHQAVFVKTIVAQKNLYKIQYTISGDRDFFLRLYCNGYVFKHISQPIVYFDSGGIGSVSETIEERRSQFYKIKREYFSDQIVNDIEMLITHESEYFFVMRILPLRLFYILFKKLKHVKNKLRWMFRISR